MSGHLTLDGDTAVRQFHRVVFVDLSARLWVTHNSMLDIHRSTEFPRNDVRRFSFTLIRKQLPSVPLAQKTIDAKIGSLVLGCVK